MHMKEQGIRAAAAAALGALCAYGVQMFVPLVVLVAAMMLDYATGLAKAYSAGELSSRVGIRGILKKLGYLVIVAVAGCWIGSSGTVRRRSAGSGHPNFWYRRW